MRLMLTLRVQTLQRQAIVRARRFSGPIRNSRFESIIVNAGRMAPPDKPMRFIGMVPVHKPGFAITIAQDMAVTS